MVFKNYDNVGIELDKVFIAHKDKTRERWEWACISHAHEVTKNHRREEWKSARECSQESCEGCNWAYTLPKKH